uniref:FmdB family transcriptional regulator n=1 Tax=Meloidogyne hapla TaxID=6305 RepID=A0A1I8BKH2_MELHA
MSMSNVYIDPNPKVDYICQEYNGTTEAKGDMTPIDSFEANKAGDGQSCKYSTKEYSLKAKTDNKENNVKQENQKENKENNQKENDKTRK